MKRIFELTEMVLSRNPDANIQLIENAYVFAARAHGDQKRKSGEMYIIHPIAVAEILTDLNMDAPSIATALLHDTVEDTHVTLEMIEENFGAEIAGLVNALTKIGQIHFSSSEHKQAENFRKMIMATAQDVRVLVIKLADRLHNMRTLSFMSDAKKRSISTETMQIYAPLAHRLGIHWVKQDLDDLSFSYLEPEEFATLSKKMQEKRAYLEHACERVEKTLEKALQRHKISAKVEGRTKHIYSLYEKMQRKHVSFDGIYDLVAFRVIVEDTQQCYHVLGMMHALYRPVPGSFKDYIALPKPNGYQSLHTAVMGPEKHRIEIQIRTQAMHDYANAGVAAHWLYKGDSSVLKDGKYQLPWLQNLTKLLEDSSNPDELLENVRMDLFLKEVYVFSRNGEQVFALPYGSSPLDFAYAVHSDVGHHCIGARVNGEQVSLGTLLKNGDQVEILTDPDQSPSRNWLKFVKSSRAKQHLRQWMRRKEREINVQLGTQILRDRLKVVAVPDLIWQSNGFSSVNELKEQLGRGDISIKQVAQWFDKRLDKTWVESVEALPVAEQHIHAAACCRPIPGDRVVGCFKSGVGIEVHYCRCGRIDDGKEHDWREVIWNEESDRLYPTVIEITNRNKHGMLSAVSGAIAAHHANIEDVRVEQSPGGVSSLRFLIEVKSRVHLAEVMRNVRALEHVISVKRCLVDGMQPLPVNKAFGEKLRAILKQGKQRWLQRRKLKRGAK
ncbi:MAG: bifunctional (p)ppGpp synthetase/guanosine-3',5'-bis(diphosphate) 3'-pyrophosphohydrolase [Zetaproteobacteria bacterium]|nr:bifunctional (p)ppGpp synthetase/guanosine-3',5'-bis(diphosphate) 3'-pyrophosphohydrolase [Zetaproteobacteria bacterium]